VIEKCAEKSRRRAGGDGTRAACAPQPIEQIRLSVVRMENQESL
jgi:hypothetical protein